MQIIPEIRCSGESTFDKIRGLKPPQGLQGVLIFLKVRIEKKYGLAGRIKLI